MRKNIINFVVVIMLCAAFSFAAYNIPASTNNTILFQGYLASSNGQPFFGTVSMGFRFYRNEIGTTLIGTDTDLIRLVQVFNGQYATKLALPDAVLNNLNAEDDIWVRVYVKEGRSSSNVGELYKDEYALTPLVQLTSALYANLVRGFSYNDTDKILRIGKGYINAAAATNGQSSPASNGMIVSGNVGIGTTAPVSARLVVNGELAVENSIVVYGNMTSPITGTNGGVYGAVWN